jgi:Fic-DOC domain mobile mystery protein B
VGLNLTYTAGQTPLDEDEKEGLLIPGIATRIELDEFEQQNIEQAVQWTMGRSFKPSLIFTEAFVCRLHKKMYGQVWSWAGTFRRTNKNIGVDKWQIPLELKKLLDDANYWFEHSMYSPDEFAIRFKHRLVSIHCFPNGNGRHSRLMADLLVEKLYQQPVFTWGAQNAMESTTLRNHYLKAIRTADRGDFNELILFARS